MRVPVGVKVGVFSLAVMGSYSWFANSIPQIESKPPQELSLEGGNVTPAQLAELARKTRVTCFKDTGGDAVKFNHNGKDIWTTVQ